jgi:hypothetical protein
VAAFSSAANAPLVVAGLAETGDLGDALAGLAVRLMVLEAGQGAGAVALLDAARKIYGVRVRLSGRSARARLSNRYVEFTSH